MNTRHKKHIDKKQNRNRKSKKYAKTEILIGILSEGQNQAIQRGPDVNCQYEPIGCPWYGQEDEMEGHIKKCPHRSTEADKLQLIIDTEIEREKQKGRLLENVIDLLKYENVDYYDITLQRKESEFEDNKFQFESENFLAVGFSWRNDFEISCSQLQGIHVRVTIEVSKVRESPELRFYVQYCDSSRNTYYHKVAMHLTNSSGTVWKIKPKAWIHEFTQSASVTPHYTLPIDDADDIHQITHEDVLYMRIFLFKHK